MTHWRWLDSLEITWLAHWRGLDTLEMKWLAEITQHIRNNKAQRRWRGSFRYLGALEIKWLVGDNAAFWIWRGALEINWLTEIAWLIEEDGSMEMTWLSVRSWLIILNIDSMSDNRLSRYHLVLKGKFSGLAWLEFVTATVQICILDTWGCHDQAFCQCWTLWIPGASMRGIFNSAHMADTCRWQNLNFWQCAQSGCLEIVWMEFLTVHTADTW